MEVYSAEIEEKMQRFFGWLSEKDRRRYAAIEAAKLGCDLSHTYGSYPLLILLANCSAEDRVLEQFLKSRRPRLGAWFPHEPMTDPYKVDRCRGQHMLEVRFRLPNISGPAQPMGTDPFGQGPLNAGTFGILRGICRGGFACPGCL